MKLSKKENARRNAVFINLYLWAMERLSSTKNSRMVNRRRNVGNNTKWMPSNPCKTCNYCKMDDYGEPYCGAPKRDCLPHQKYIEIRYYLRELLEYLQLNGKIKMTEYKKIRGEMEK
jgi:hypothetical protein